MGGHCRNIVGRCRRLDNVLHRNRNHVVTYQSHRNSNKLDYIMAIKAKCEMRRRMRPTLNYPIIKIFTAAVYRKIHESSQILYQFNQFGGHRSQGTIACRNVTRVPPSKLGCRNRFVVSKFRHFKVYMSEKTDLIMKLRRLHKKRTRKS